MFVLTAVIHKEEEMYIAECPEVGTVSQGFTIEEAVANLKEATELYLEEFPLEGELRGKGRNSCAKAPLTEYRHIKRHFEAGQSGPEGFCGMSLTSIQGKKSRLQYESSASPRPGGPPLPGPTHSRTEPAMGLAHSGCIAFLRKGFVMVFQFLVRICAFSVNCGASVMETSLATGSNKWRTILPLRRNAP